MKKLYLLLIVSMLFSCADLNFEKESGDLTTPIDTPEASYDMSGAAQDGFCAQGGIVTIFTLNDDVDLSQTGFSFQVEITGVFGEFTVSSRVTNRFVEAFAEVSCLNEITGLMMDKNLSAIIDLTEGSVHTLSPLSTVSKSRIRELYSIGNFTAARQQSESEILILMGMTSITKSFSELNIVGDTTDDRVLIIANTMMLNNRTVAEQNELMTQIGQAVLSGADPTSDLANQLEADEMSLPLQAIKDNLNAKYIELGGTEQSFSKFWEGVDSDGDGIPNSEDQDQAVEMDMMSRDPVIQGGFDIDNTCSASFPDSAPAHFAFPYVFNSTVESAKYILMNVDGDYLTIYDNNVLGCDGRDCPGTPLFTINKIPVNYFDRSLQDTDRTLHGNLPQNFSGALGTNQIPYDQNVWIVMSKDVSYRPQMGCTGTPVAFSRNHYSADGVTWFLTGNASVYTQAMWRMVYTN